MVVPSPAASLPDVLARTLTPQLQAALKQPIVIAKGGPTKEVGASPLQFIEVARLEAARRLLEDGNLPLKSVAKRVGLGSDQSLRKLFLKHLGVGPNEYRARFGGAPGE